ncbi:tRNA (adenosine(37)-N6)-threonylcarbamoyltransferase complex ATPase subunit type 1 TsaE [Thermocrispum agreste]|uniref:tRNA (adenosine(37)-N6)-threonylcarbamoyltransferase complex ATPase subunit type 1 TsaE n=1 Tax=Thermocrispum agreste TaxID=37925 RepID=UPI003CCC09B3
MVAVKLELPTPEDTVDLGKAIGAQARAGDLVLLTGPLGAGKTVLVKGIAAALGVQGRVSSPTFVLARVHEPGPRGVGMVHIDAYRLGGDVDQLEDLGIDTAADDSVVVVEWGEFVADRFGPDYLLVRLERRPDDVRVAELEPHGSWKGRSLPG